MSTAGFADMLAALTSAMPAWTSFEDPRLQSREIRYKREASLRAQAMLAQDVMEELISQGDWDGILTRLEDVGKLTNLLWNQVPLQGDMAILFTEKLDKEGFSRQVFDLLHGTDEPMARFEQYVAYVNEHELPNRWPFPTYLLFLFHPETEFFVKPSVAQWFLKQTGEDRAWASQPSVELYQTIKDHVRAFGEFLASYNPTDMIDLQSAIYMAWYEIPRTQKKAVWWVNQGTTYKAAREGGFLWAPLRNKIGRTEYHWETMADVRPGDIVLHYSNNAVRAVSRVTEAATLRPSPPEIASSHWESEGRYVKADYTHFDQPIPIETLIEHQEVRSIPRGPVNAKGTVKQGYLFPFRFEGLSKVVSSASVNWPEYVHEALGTGKSTSSSAWLFQANPDRYNVMGAVSDLDELTWTVHQYANKVHEGDTAYIWESGSTAGVIAVAKVLSEPEMVTRLDEEEAYFIDKSLAGSEPAMRVRVGIQQVLSNRITRQQFKDHPVLSEVSILKQAQGTVFPLSSEQEAALDEMITVDQGTWTTLRVSVNLSRWDSFLDQGYLCVGWREVGDLQQYASPEEIAQAVHQHFAEQYSTERQREAVARQLWQFRSLQPGDEVIATQGTSALLASGRVLDPGYTWNMGENGLGHVLRVEWDESVAQRVSKQPRWRTAVVEEADSDLIELAHKPGPGLPRPVIDLAAVCNQFASALQDSHIGFGPRHDEVVRSFVTSLATKRFVILTGLSGSGKTQIAVRFGEWLGKGRSRVVAVRPDWTGSEALFGYEDALQQSDGNGLRPWHVPETLDFMLKAAGDPEHPYLLVLDEMNLAHVERYFADVLSGMESDQPVLPNLVEGEDGRWRLDPDGPERIAIPENLFVVGTVNVDETTYMFSPKVLDRANTIEFRVDSDDLSAGMRRPTPVDPGDLGLVRGFLAIATDEDWHLQQSSAELSQFTSYLRTLHRLLSDTQVQFGHRVVYEANRFAALLSSAGESNLHVALDLQVLQKVLPRVHGSRRRLEPVLSALGRFCFDPDAISQDGEAADTTFDPLSPPEGDPKLPRSFRKLQRMTKNLRTDQFTSFAE